MDGENTPKVVQVGGRSKLPFGSLRPQKFGGKQVIVVAALILLVLVLITAVYLIATKPALKVGRYSYNKKEYAKLIAQAKSVNVNEQDARKALVKSLASREAADRLKISYQTDINNLNAAAGYEFKNTANINDYQRAAAIYRVVDANVRLETKGGYKASIVYLPFSRYMYGFAKDSDTAKKANFLYIHNQGAVLKDVGDARKKGEDFRNAISSGQKTTQQVIQAVRSDQVLNYDGEVNQSRLVLFTADKTEETYGGKGAQQYLPRDQSQMIEATKDSVGKPSGLVEELVPLDKLVATPQVTRSNYMAVGYYFIVVHEAVQAKGGVQSQYDKLVSELNHV